MARRRGIGRALCEEVEVLAESWGYTFLHLLVERENVVARSLYRDKLGYNEVFMQKVAPTLRVYSQSGKFVIADADTLILAKAL
jgi:ribosomal protein S18 acetylase RimI-like enzyme